MKTQIIDQIPVDELFGKAIEKAKQSEKFALVVKKITLKITEKDNGYFLQTIADIVPTSLDGLLTKAPYQKRLQHDYETEAGLEDAIKNLILFSVHDAKTSGLDVSKLMSNSIEIVIEGAE